MFASAAALACLGLVGGMPARLAAVMIFLVAGFLVTFAYATNDYFSYQRIYEGITSIENLGILGYPVDVATPVEPGFALLVLLEKSLAGSFVVFWFSFTAISLLVKFYAFRELSPFLMLSVLIYLGDEYFWKDLSGIRGAMASGLVLLSLIFVHRRQPLYFALALLAALSFHFSAIVAAPIYWYRLLSGRLFLLSVFVVSTTLAALGGMGLFLPEIASALGMDATSRLIKYAESRYASGITPFGGTFMIHMAVVTFLLAMYRQLVQVWPYNRILITSYVLGTSLMFMFIDYGIIAGRIREILCVPSGAVLLPSFVLLFKGQQRLVPYFALVAYSALWFFLMTRDRMPYQNVLFST